MCPELAHGANADRDWPSACQCELIHTVREDIASRIDALPWDLRSARRRNGLGLLTFTRRDAYLRAARVARGEA
jgi:hypothetical protein